MVQRKPLVRRGARSLMAKLGKFTVPSWASDTPVSTHRLEAIKDGAVVHSLDLAKRPYFVLGKQKELCHVEVNPTD